MELINLNGDATALIIDTAIVKRDVLSNQLEEESSEILERFKSLVDENPNLN